MRRYTPRLSTCALICSNTIVVFIVIPALVCAFSALFATILYAEECASAWVEWNSKHPDEPVMSSSSAEYTRCQYEEWFLYVTGNLVGAQLTDVAPQSSSTLSKFLDLFISVWSLSITGSVVGIITGLGSMVAFNNWLNYQIRGTATLSQQGCQHVVCCGCHHAQSNPTTATHTDIEMQQQQEEEEGVEKKESPAACHVPASDMLDTLSAQIAALVQTVKMQQQTLEELKLGMMPIAGSPDLRHSSLSVMKRASCGAPATDQSVKTKPSRAKHKVKVPKVEVKMTEASKIAEQLSVRVRERAQREDNGSGLWSSRSHGNKMKVFDESAKPKGGTTASLEAAKRSSAAALRLAVDASQTCEAQGASSKTKQ